MRVARDAQEVDRWDPQEENEGKTWVTKSYGRVKLHDGSVRKSSKP